MSPRKTPPPKLSDAELAKLRCPPGRKDALIFDATLPGFGVRVTADGKRVFLFQYRVGPRVRRHRIGVWGEGDLTATRARKEAEQLRGLVRAGRDPVADRRAAQLATVAADREAREAAAVDAFTFGKLVDAWQTKGIAHRRPSYVTDATARLRDYFSAWKDRAAASITKTDAIAALDRVEKGRGTISARRALAYARAAYNWAEKRDLLNGNPFRGTAAPGKENPRDRVLTAEEIAGIWRAGALIASPQGTYIRVLLLTLQRLEEVAGMRWDELTPDLTTWTIPATRAKNGRAHLVHLAPAVRDLIRALPRWKDNPLVFVSRRGGKLGGFSHMKNELIEAMQPDREARTKSAAEGNSHRRIAVDWRFHDFRRTGVTVLANMGTPPHVADKLLNHVTGSIQGVAAVYQRAQFLAERQIALETWASHLLQASRIPR